MKAIGREGKVLEERGRSWKRGKGPGREGKVLEERGRFLKMG